jgi:hypothetical protein
MFVKALEEEEEALMEVERLELNRAAAADDEEKLARMEAAAAAETARNKAQARKSKAECDEYKDRLAKAKKATFAAYNWWLDWGYSLEPDETRTAVALAEYKECNERYVAARDKYRKKMSAHKRLLRKHALAGCGRAMNTIWAGCGWFKRHECCFY